MSLDDILDAVTGLVICLDEVFKTTREVTTECSIFSFKFDQSVVPLDAIK